MLATIIFGILLVSGLYLWYLRADVIFLDLITTWCS